MVGSNFDEKEYRKEIRKIRSKLFKESRKIRGASNEASQFLPSKIKEIEKSRGRKTFKSMTLKELRIYYRDIQEIAGLKSSTLEGAISVRDEAKDMASKLTDMTDEQKDRFFSIYGKLYEYSKGLVKDFRYEIFGSTIDYVNKYGQESADFALYTLLDKFQELYEEYGNIYSKEFKDEFVQFIEMFREFPK